MAAIPLGAYRYGRGRSSNFFALLHTDIDEDHAWQQALWLYEEARQILCQSLTIDENCRHLPLNVAVSDEHHLANILFCLCKYDSDVRLTVYANDFNLYTGNQQADSTVI